jgi:hypothetical protein
MSARKVIGTQVPRLPRPEAEILAVDRLSLSRFRGLVRDLSPSFHSMPTTAIVA